MKYKKEFIFICLIICLFSIASVCASDVNETVVANENQHDELLSIDNPNNVEILFEDSNDTDELSATDEEKLGGYIGTFDNLYTSISRANGEFNLSGNYKYYSADSHNSAIKKSIIINGNGFTLDGLNQSYPLKILSSNVVLKNITFQDFSSFAENLEFGGAIYCEGDNCSLIDCTFKNCRLIVSSANFEASIIGGGAVYWSGKYGSLINCTFNDCKVSTRITPNKINTIKGGAIYLDVDNCSVLNCHFTDCGCFDDDAAITGGAIYLLSNNATFDNCKFINCAAGSNSLSTSSTGRGGALSGANFILTNCLFKNNFARSFGGAITGKPIEINNCSFEYNRVKKSGGAINFENVQTKVINSHFLNNNANEKGGALYTQYAYLNISNCSFNSNYATDGGAIASLSSSKGIISFSYFNYNSADNSGGALYFGTFDVLNCEFKNNTANTYYDIYNGQGKYKIKDCVFSNALNLAIKYQKVLYNCKFKNVIYGKDPELRFNVTINQGCANINVVMNNAITTYLTVYFDLVSSYSTNANQISIPIKNGKGNYTENLYSEGVYKIVFEYPHSISFHDYSESVLISVYATTLSINVSNTEYNQTNVISFALDKKINTTLYVNVDKVYYINITEGYGFLTLSNLSPKRYTVYAKFSGLNEYLPSNNSTTFNVFKSKPKIEINVSDIQLYDIAKIHVKIYCNYSIINGVLSIYNDDLGKFMVNIINGECDFNMSGLSAGKQIIYIEFRGNNYYDFSNATCSFNVLENISIINLQNLEAGYSGKVCNIYLSETATGTVILTINNTDYLYDIIEGEVNILIPDLGNGNYSYVLTYLGDEEHFPFTKTGTLTIKNIIPTTLTSSAVTTVYNGGKYLVATLKDSQGNVISGVKISITLNGKVYTLTTDKNGQVKLSTNGLVPVKTYAATISFAGNTNYAKFSKTVNVVVKKATPKLTAKAKTFKKSVKTKKYTVTLKTNQNKVMKRTLVTLKVNKKTYKVRTNSKGQATFKITNLNKKGKFTAVVKYAGSKYYTAKTVKPKIIIK